ncbi:MAG: response regulator [Bacteroidota bacterium]|nr:response regulator [Bacteroidota bacterium]
MPEIKLKRVLVVDDEEAMRTIMYHYLSDNGYEVATVSTGEECLEKVPAYKPDVILLDIMMPGIHGFDVLKQLKADPATSSIGVVMCSAKDYKPEKDLAFQQGAYGYLTKPFTLAQLLTIVKECLYRPRSPQTPPPSLVPTSGKRFTVTLDRSKPYIRFWGTRGSVPVSGTSFLRHGGNTPCLEVNDGHSTIIIDAGTGIRELGVRLMSEPPRPIHLFIGHTHWDHIQGFPFFVPAFRPETSLTVYGVSGFGKDLRSIFSGQLDADYFPVQLPDLPGTIEFRQLSESPTTVGSLKMYWEYVHHPGAAVGFKFSLNGKTIVYMTDNEFLKGYRGAPDAALLDAEILSRYSNLLQFINDADVLISESQYTNEEYEKKIGWGHTMLSNGCLLCKLCNVKRWIVTHHDPMHTDDFLQEKLLLTRQILNSIEYSIPVSHAFDGLTEYF